MSQNGKLITAVLLNKAYLHYIPVCYDHGGFFLFDPWPAADLMLLPDSVSIFCKRIVLSQN